MEELHNLWNFVQVAEAGSFSAAAKRLGLSPAALSKSVSILESKLGVRLFQRTTRSLQLTDEGSMLVTCASKSFGEIAQSFERLRLPNKEPAGIVRMSTTTSFGRQFILPILPEFLDRYPKVQLLVSFHDEGQSVSRQSCDVRITWGEELERGKVARLLRRHHLILIASPAYLARKGIPRHPEDLKEHACISILLPDGKCVEWRLRDRKNDGTVYTLSPRSQFTVMHELDVLTDAALSGLGITIQNADTVHREMADGRLIRVLPDYDVIGQSDLAMDIVIQYPQRKHQPSRVQVLVDYLLEKLQHSGGGHGNRI